MAIAQSWHESMELASIATAMTVDEVKRLLGKAPTKYCILDLVPTWLLKRVGNVISPMIARMWNTSFEQCNLSAKQKMVVWFFVIFTASLKLLLNLHRCSVLSPHSFCRAIAGCPHEAIIQMFTYMWIICQYTTCIEWPEMNAKIDKYILDRWQWEYDDSPNGAHYKNIEPNCPRK